MPSSWFRLWSYAYDPIGNRTQSVAQTSMTYNQTHYQANVLNQYDYLGRRVRKDVYTRDPNGAWNATPTTSRAFVWDGWLLLMGLDCKVVPPAVPQPVRSYTWGLDLAGQAGASEPGTRVPGLAGRAALEAAQRQPGVRRWTRHAAASAAPPAPPAGCPRSPIIGDCPSFLPTGNPKTDFDAANQAAGLTETPAGYTWHHHQDIGRMQLVPSDLHAKTGHTGGASIWGGGY